MSAGRCAPGRSRSSPAWSRGRRPRCSSAAIARWRTSRTISARLVDERRKQPGDYESDVLTRLIQGEKDGARLSTLELYHNCIFLLNAGHETTTNLIGNGLWLLLTNEDQFSRLKSEPALIADRDRGDAALRRPDPAQQPPAHRSDRARAARRCRQGPSSPSASARRTATRASSRTPSASTSRASPTATSRSATASTPAPG